MNISTKHKIKGIHVCCLQFKQLVMINVLPMPLSATFYSSYFQCQQLASARWPVVTPLRCTWSQGACRSEENRLPPQGQSSPWLGSFLPMYGVKHIDLVSPAPIFRPSTASSKFRPIRSPCHPHHHHQHHIHPGPHSSFVATLTRTRGCRTR